MMVVVLSPLSTVVNVTGTAAEKDDDNGVNEEAEEDDVQWVPGRTSLCLQDSPLSSTLTRCRQISPTMTGKCCSYRQLVIS